MAKKAVANVSMSSCAHRLDVVKGCMLQANQIPIRREADACRMCHFEITSTVEPATKVGSTWMPSRASCRPQHFGAQLSGERARGVLVCACVSAGGELQASGYAGQEQFD